ncbi:CAP domain-containing protein [Hydrogenoanaerobacterium sp.]|uniref:CAP domain-containing protein n=1 Tax=Hydrogenoanaerobacterium sp. TaxID=2953763 RepID=UPI00289E7C5F|nr:CAP domain-containing protein [Hydrogenoanaerobacterium sp.]
MRQSRILSLLLALCLLLSACQRNPQSSSEPLSSSEQVAPSIDLSEGIKTAMLEDTAEEYVDEHSNVAVEQTDKTLGISYVERFYRNYLDNVPDELYIGRYTEPAVTIYHLQFEGGSSYKLTVITDNERTQHELKEINKTENEYIFTTDKEIAKKAVEVGRRGSNGLTINNLCGHTWEHEIDSELIKLVGSEKFEQWKENSASRTQCNINIFEFLKFFNISYDSFMQSHGSRIEDKERLNEIIKQIYPEQLKPAPTQENTPPSTANSSDGDVPAENSTKTVEVSGKNFLGDVEQGIIDEINAERESLGLSKLKYDKNLRSAARIRSRELCKSGVWDHTRPNGDPWQTVLSEDIPVKYVSAGENLANVEYNDPRVSLHTDANWWFEEWKSSPAHYENICREEFTHIGAGVYYVEEDNGMTVAYATTIFAKF